MKKAYKFRNWASVTQGPDIAGNDAKLSRVRVNIVALDCCATRMQMAASMAGMRLDELIFQATMQAVECIEQREAELAPVRAAEQAARAERDRKFNEEFGADDGDDHDFNEGGQ